MYCVECPNYDLTCHRYYLRHPLLISVIILGLYYSKMLFWVFCCIRMKKFQNYHETKTYNGNYDALSTRRTKLWSKSHFIHTLSKNEQKTSLTFVLPIRHRVSIPRVLRMYRQVLASLRTSSSAEYTKTLYLLIQ